MGLAGLHGFSGLNGLVLAASDSEPVGNLNGSWGLLVFAFLAVVVFFLFRSMNKHLRKVQRMKEEEMQADDARRRDAAPPRQPRPPKP